MMALQQSVQDYLEEHREGFVGLLRQLVEMESPTSDPASQQPLLHLLAAEFRQLDWAVRLWPGRRSGGALLARRKGFRGERRQLILGHCDTVWPLGTLARMPFRREGERLFGPGIFDMKAGLGMLIWAIRALQALDIPYPLGPVVLINSDEEMGSFESSRWIRQLARLAERTLVLEPALGPTGQLKTARKGVGGFEVVVEGRAAHAGLNPEEGASAILELAIVIQKLFALNDPQRGVSVNVGTIEGGLRTNVVAPRSSARVDVRVPNQVEADRIGSAILGLEPSTPGVRLRVEGRFGRPPLERTSRNQALWRQACALGAQLGLALEEGAAGGGSDGSTASLYSATLDGLGAVGDGAHADHEHIELTASLQRCALLALLLAAPAGTGSDG